VIDADTATGGGGSDTSTTGSDVASGGSGNAPNFGVSTVTGINLGGGGEAGRDVGAGGAPGEYMLPDGFTATEFGGYKLGDPADDEAGGEGKPGEGCGAVIVGLVRDFRRGDRDGGHPDFQTYSGNGEKGIVQFELGDDRKPVYADGDHLMTTSKGDFDQWYRNVDGVNEAYALQLSFEPNGDVWTFHSSEFFPLDGVGFGDDGNPDNYHFTTEIHTTFAYKGGESFTFIGDDDLWVYINGRLAIDLGGLHPEQTETIDMDERATALGIEPGNSYALDLFHAERRTLASHFRVETDLEFTNCGEIIDPVIK